MGKASTGGAGLGTCRRLGLRNRPGRSHRSAARPAGTGACMADYGRRLPTGNRVRWSLSMPVSRAKDCKPTRRRYYWPAPSDSHRRGPLASRPYPGPRRQSKDAPPPFGQVGLRSGYRRTHVVWVGEKPAASIGWCPAHSGIIALVSISRERKISAAVSAVLARILHPE